MSDSAGVSPDPTNRGGLPTLLVRLFVGGTLLYLGWKKTGDPHAFMKGIEQYGVLPLEPPQLINGVAVLLPFLEIAIGLSLIVGLLRRGGATISARWPLPTGVSRSMTRIVTGRGPVSSLIG